MVMHGINLDLRPTLHGLRWIHADVFGDAPFAGNGLAIFPQAGGLSTDQMLELTRELRQFEAIFLGNVAVSGRVLARIFTAEEELDFAGHPLLGAAAVLHYLDGSAAPRSWRFKLNKSEIPVRTILRSHGFRAEMNQGIPVFEPVAPDEKTRPVLKGLGLEPAVLADGLPIVTISTGLPYVIVPVKSEALAQARINCTDFEHRLRQLRGKFVYVLDPRAYEGRTWDNLGLVEDIATGSAAGPAAAYLQRYCGASDKLTIHQGRFTGRRSEISVTCDRQTGSMQVSGDVVILAEGRFL